MIGWQELLIIFLIVLLLFGAKRLPEIAKGLGKAVSEFKRSKDEIINSPPAETKEEKTEAEDRKQS